jgi:hypothetical protein
MVIAPVSSSRSAALRGSVMGMSTFLLSSHNLMWRNPTQWNVKKELAGVHSINLCAQPYC